MGDKKKIIIMGALGVAILGVGAFQLMGGSPPPAPAAEAKKGLDKPDFEQGKDGEKKDLKNPQYANLLPQRDPFAQPNIPELAAPAQPPVPTTPTPATTQGGSKSSGRKIRVPSTYGGDGEPQIRPLPLGGEIGKGGVPPVGGGAMAGPGLKVEPTYTVTGVIVGKKPAAVFVDSQGNQRLIQEGQMIDDDAKVVGIEKGKVRIRRKDGKEHSIELTGGSPNGK
ncbi:MAG: hypothetical protein JST35_09715 [Armatimonadetes bacterium]|nr:hypothetical protein [Armatimonadota bacterium]